MDKIANFVKAYLPFLLGGGKYKVEEADETSENGSNSVVVFSSEKLRLRFVTDRRQLFLDLQPVGPESGKEWYSIDLVRRLFTGKREPSAVLDPSFAEFLRDRIGDIEQKFDATEWSSTKAELKALKRVRSKEMFG